MTIAIRRIGALMAATALTTLAWAGGGRAVSFEDPQVLTALQNVTQKYYDASEGKDMLAFYQKAPTLDDYKQEFKRQGCADAIPAFVVITAQTKEVFAGQLRNMKATGDKMDTYTWRGSLTNIATGLNAWKSHEYVNLPRATSEAIFQSGFSLEDKCTAYAMGRQSEFFVAQIKKIEKPWFMPSINDNRSPENARAIAEARYKNPAYFAATVAIDMFTKFDLKPKTVADYSNKLVETETFNRGDALAFNILLQRNAPRPVVTALFSTVPNLPVAQNASSRGTANYLSR